MARRKYLVASRQGTIIREHVVMTVLLHELKHAFEYVVRQDTQDDVRIFGINHVETFNHQMIIRYDAHPIFLDKRAHHLFSAFLMAIVSPFQSWRTASNHLRYQPKR